MTNRKAALMRALSVRPRFALAHLPTPLQRAANFER